jgi:pimeloyl-ACP methyl ester carboxylesterase
VVCLPGLQRWWGVDGSAADLPGAVATFSGHSGYITGVRETLRTLPAGSTVTLVGHSQGGMVAQSLAADAALRAARVHVDAVLTAGSPHGGTDPPAQVAYVALENDADPVPALRGLVSALLPAIPQQRAPGRIVVRFPRTHDGLTVANHMLGSGGYLAAAASDDPRVSDFRWRTREFFPGAALSLRVYQVVDRGGGLLP